MFSKEAIDYLVNQGIKPQERYVSLVDSLGEERYFIVNNEGNPVEVKAKISTARDTLQLKSLTGLVEYIKSNLDRSDVSLFLHVEDERKVSLQSTLLPDGTRESLVSVHAIVPQFQYEFYYDVEEMIINFQSKFRQTKDRDIVLQVVGNVKEENVRQTGDTGVAQAVTIKTGISNASDVVVPNPVTLAPYRTFLEVEQPESDFIFRMKEGPKGAIFEADGGAWRNQAISNIRDYLQEELALEVQQGRVRIIA